MGKLHLLSIHSLCVFLMDTQCMPSSSSSSLNPKTQKKAETIQSWATNHQLKSRICFKYYRISYTAWTCQWRHSEKKASPTVKTWATKGKRGVIQPEEEPVRVAKKKGTIAGAVALIIGTSIGSGILALPKKAAPAGLLPSSILIIICWAFLLIEALLLIEINVGLRMRKMDREEEGELEVISIRTMAQETLGDWGGTLATVTYVFLGYTSIIAYISKSEEILFNLVNIPESVSGFLFTALFTLLISIGGTRATDQVNQWLTASMIGLLLAIEVLAIMYGGWSGFEGNSNWSKVPATTPVVIFSLVYHDVAPVLCAYLGGDLTRLRAAVLLGSLVPMAALLVWNAIALGLSTQADQLVDPVELLTRVKWSGVSLMVETFSLLAIGTASIGTLLSFSEFFKEQLKELSWPTKVLQKQKQLSWLRNWWGKNRISFTAMAMVVTPSLFVSTTVPDAFSAATDIAGGYCMTMLYGVLPPAMALAMYSKKGEDSNQKPLPYTKLALLGLGLFACGIVLEQILQDFLALHP